MKQCHDIIFSNIYGKLSTFGRTVQHFHFIFFFFHYFSVADLGFSPGGAPTPKIAIIFQIFAENCMKMKEFGPPGGGVSLAPLPLDPAM